MFNHAYTLASKYTFPFIISMKFFDGSVESGLGSFVMINQEGWALTAAHNFNIIFSYNQHQQEIKAYQERINIINASQQLSVEEKEEQRKSIPANPKWIVEYGIFLGGNLVPIYDTHIHGDHDIAFFKIDKSGINPHTIYPKFKNHRNISPGTSLCKLGYPFIQFSTTFDESSRRFVLPPNLIPLPFFPNEGIYTRNQFRGINQEGQEILYLETSSPGLKGQSGGPIFDTNGVIYAIQSQNQTIELGFKGMAFSNGQQIEENQFLNLGLGVHPKTLELLMTKYGIEYESAE